MTARRKPGTKAAEPAEREEIERRVNLIADRMARGEWVGRRDARDLAEGWGVAKRTVQNYSQRASERLYRKDSDRERHELRVSTLCKLELIAERAMRDDDPKSLHVAVAALDKAVEVGGAKTNVAQVVNVKVERGLDEILTKLQARLPPAEYDRALRALVDETDLPKGEPDPEK